MSHRPRSRKMWKLALVVCLGLGASGVLLLGYEKVIESWHLSRLDHPDLEVQVRSLEWLDEHRSPRAIRRVLAYLENSGGYSISRSPGKICGEDTSPHCPLEVLTDRDSEEDRELVWASLMYLARVQGAEPELVRSRLLDPGAPTALRFWMLRSSHLMGPESIDLLLPTIRTCLEDPDPRIRTASENALRWIIWSAENGMLPPRFLGVGLPENPSRTTGSGRSLNLPAASSPR